MHNLYPEQTQFINVKKITSELGELIAYNDPITHQNGYSSMSIRLRIDLSQPLIFGLPAPNNHHGVNWIAFQFLELPRLFCNCCNRLGHVVEDCTDIYILSQQRMQSPDSPLPPPPHNTPEPEDNYTDEERFNVDIDVPDSDWSDWSLEVHHSPVSSGQNQSAISFLEGDLDFEGYNQRGFNSHMSTDSNSNNINISSSSADDSVQAAQPIQLEEESTLPQQNHDLSPVNFLTSDIHIDFALVSDSSSSSQNSRPMPEKIEP